MRISDWSSDVCSSDLDLEAAQYAFEAIQGHVLSDLHGNVAESYPIEQPGARHCPPRRIPRHPKENFQCPGFPSSIPARPPRSARQCSTRSTEIGRASSRKRVCQYVSISVVAVSLKKKKKHKKKKHKKR